MEKHNFKIGDKVKLKDPRPFPHLGTRVLTIVDLDCGYKYLPVWYEGMSWSYFPVLPSEIKHVVKVGEQLLFSFMSEATKLHSNLKGE